MVSDGRFAIAKDELMCIVGHYFVVLGKSHFSNCAIEGYKVDVELLLYSNPDDIVQSATQRGLCAHIIS